MCLKANWDKRLLELNFLLKQKPLQYFSLNICSTSTSAATISDFHYVIILAKKMITISIEF